MPRLGSVEIRNSLEGKTRARSPLGGSRQHYHGSGCLTHSEMVRTYLSGEFSNMFNGTHLWFPVDKGELAK